MATEGNGPNIATDKLRGGFLGVAKFGI